MSGEQASIDSMIARRITSPYKQHATLMTVGSTGTGKSYAMLRLCENIAKKTADILGGDPGDYFNIDHVAIITMSEVKRVTKSFKQHGIYLFDDIGVGWNARKYKSEGNIILNDIIQTFRPNNNFLGMSLPDSFLIDKVPRSLVHYFMEMDAPIFESGLSVGKFFIVKRKPRAGDTYFEYPQFNGGRYIRYAFKLPSLELVKDYDRRREEQYAIMEEERMERWAAMETGATPSPPTLQKTIKDKVLELRTGWEAGEYGNLTFKQLCKSHKINYGTAKNYI